MTKEKNNLNTEEANNLADRLGRRKDRGQGSGEDLSRLGNRLANRLREFEEEDLTGPPEEMDEKASDFFNEFMRLSDKYPELKDTTVNELKDIIAKIGMKHPDEVIRELKREKGPSEVEEYRDRYVTY